MCVFDQQAGEQQNSGTGFERPESEGTSGDGSWAEKVGAAVWTDIQVPVVRAEGWPVYHLQMGLRELERLRREIEAAMALLTGAMPQSRDTVADIARNSGVSNREARRRKSVADVCGKVKGALEKLQSGEVSNEHVSALAPVADMPGAASLLKNAASKSPEELTKDVEEFRLSSACGEDMAKRQRARRSLRFFAGPDGTIGINGLLPPIEGTELKNRLAAIVDAQWRKDHPNRARTLGGHNDETQDQRMADALLSIAGIRAPPSDTSSPSKAETIVMKRPRRTTMPPRRQTHQALLPTSRKQTAIALSRGKKPKTLHRTLHNQTFKATQQRQHLKSISVVRTGLRLLCR